MALLPTSLNLTSENMTKLSRFYDTETLSWTVCNDAGAYLATGLTASNSRTLIGLDKTSLDPYTLYQWWIHDDNTTSTISTALNINWDHAYTLIDEGRKLSQAMKIAEDKNPTPELKLRKCYNDETFNWDICSNTTHEVIAADIESRDHAMLLTGEPESMLDPLTLYTWWESPGGSIHDMKNILGICKMDLLALVAKGRSLRETV